MWFPTGMAILDEHTLVLAESHADRLTALLSGVGGGCERPEILDVSLEPGELQHVVDREDAAGEAQDERPLGVQDAVGKRGRRLIDSGAGPIDRDREGGAGGPQPEPAARCGAPAVAGTTARSNRVVVPSSERSRSAGRAPSPCLQERIAACRA